MVKYIWSKYQALFKEGYYKDDSSFYANPSSGTYFTAPGFPTDIYSSYEFDPKNNVYKPTGQRKDFYSHVNGTYYAISTNGKSITRFIINYHASTDNNFGYNSIDKRAVDNTFIAGSYSRGTLVQTGIVAEEGTYPLNGRHSDGYWYIRGASANTIPSVTLNTENNQTLYENDTFKIDGLAVDSDIGDIVNVYYRLISGTSRAIATGISTGAAIPFNEQLTFKGGKLYKGETAVTEALTEGTSHKLEVWAEDNQGGKSAVQTRTFYVVPNRAPTLTVHPFNAQSDLINADTVTFTGTTFDADGNAMVVSYKLNGGLATEVYRGKDGDWSFDLLLSALKDGENTVVVETIDSYNFKTSETRKLNKHTNLTPLASSVQRYTIVPPAGTAQGVLMWIERDEGQEITAEISMTNGTEQEQFVEMTLDSSGPSNVGMVEDFFKFRSDVPTDKIAIKLSWTGDKPIYKVSGALTQ